MTPDEFKSRLEFLTGGIVEIVERPLCVEISATFVRAGQTFRAGNSFVPSGNANTDDLILAAMLRGWALKLSEGPTAFEASKAISLIDGFPWGNSIESGTEISASRCA